MPTSRITPRLARKLISAVVVLVLLVLLCIGGLTYTQVRECTQSKRSLAQAAAYTARQARAWEEAARARADSGNVLVAAFYQGTAVDARDYADTLRRRSERHCVF
jgi:cell division protein FtsX